VTHDPRDWGAFKTPTLREVEHTAPYMHDGRLRTLDEVVEFYNKGGIKNKNLDPNMKMLHMNVRDKADLLAFLSALSGEGKFPAVRWGKRSHRLGRNACPRTGHGRRITVKLLSVTVSPA
jgi:cytochrome c peroxidase